LPQRRARSHRPRGRAERPEQRRARSHHARPVGRLNFRVSTTPVRAEPVEAPPGPSTGSGRTDKRPANMSQRISLTRYLVEKQRVDGHIPSQLRLLLEVVARACKSISHAVNKGALGGVLGSAGSENVQGEVQKKLDIIANEV